MFTVLRSRIFIEWLDDLRDQRAVAKIALRLDRVRHGNFGDVKPVGEGVSEMRIDHGPAYRLYFARRGRAVVILLCGGDKSTQTQDIARAKVLARDWKE
jgi:putative addiction module killer protein